MSSLIPASIHNTCVVCLVCVCVCTAAQLERTHAVFCQFAEDAGARPAPARSPAALLGETGIARWARVVSQVTLAISEGHGENEKFPPKLLSFVCNRYLMTENTGIYNPGGTKCSPGVNENFHAAG